MYGEHAPALFGFLLYRTGDRALSEDLLGDTFEKVLRSRGAARRRRGAEKPWLYTIALNCLRDSARRGKIEAGALARLVNETVPFHAEASAAVEADEERERLRDALATLSAQEREAIGLRFGADLSVPEIAGILGLPLPTVESRVYRGLGKLRDRLS